MDGCKTASLDASASTTLWACGNLVGSFRHPTWTNGHRPLSDLHAKYWHFCLNQPNQSESLWDMGRLILTEC